MTNIISGNDVTFITDTLAHIGSWTEQAVTIFSFGSIAATGTTEEAGDPTDVAYGTRSSNARIERVNDRMVERSSGAYQANDKTFSVRGSFASDDMLTYSAGTYRPIDGPWRYFIGSNLYWQAVCREVQT